MNNQINLYILLLAALITAAAAAGCNSSDPLPAIVVNSTEDLSDPPDGTVTLRLALSSAASGQRITFDERLDGGTIALSIVGENHTILKGEVMGMRMEPSGPVSYLVGYFERDYGKSALYARKDVVIDAATLPSGITFSWAPGASDPARVLAVYGNLTMKHVSVTGGYTVAQDISTDNPDDQPWTLARGGAVAVWGSARLENCRLYGNSCEGDFDSSRDRGAFGGGLYANIVVLEDCIVSGNTVIGAGAAGGGVYSVGGADSSRTRSTIRRTSITGNRIAGLFTYGGGVYSDGGGIGNRKMLELVNTTVARNLVEPAPGMPPFLLGMGYWRGGGIYISNGYLSIHSCTVAENDVYGIPRTDDLGKPNLAGGIAATIGNAHAVEDLTVGYSVIAGNQVHEIGGSSYLQDFFTGSLFYFRSMGYNRIGVIDFSQMLVPVGEVDWASLCRRHYPKIGDIDGVAADAVLNLSSGITHSDTIQSAADDAPGLAVLHYEPAGSALDQTPASPHLIIETFAEYGIAEGGNDDFLQIMLDRVETEYDLTGFATDFKQDFEAYLQSVDSDDGIDGIQPYVDPLGNAILTLADAKWFGPAQTWPKQLCNYPYIEFWHRLDTALAAEMIPGMGVELLGDDAWTALFSAGSLAENDYITMKMWTTAGLRGQMQSVDQLGNLRPLKTAGDIGAVEID